MRCRVLACGAGTHHIKQLMRPAPLARHHTLSTLSTFIHVLHLVVCHIIGLPVGVQLDAVGVEGVDLHAVGAGVQVVVVDGGYVVRARKGQPVVEAVLAAGKLVGKQPESLYLRAHRPIEQQGARSRNALVNFMAWMCVYRVYKMRTAYAPAKLLHGVNNFYDRPDMPRM